MPAMAEDEWGRVEGLNGERGNKKRRNPPWGQCRLWEATHLPFYWFPGARELIDVLPGSNAIALSKPRYPLFSS